jgi:hypothetical protein
MKVVKVYIETPVDENPDLSWMGEYSRKPGPCAIDRKERGDQGWNELQYFNPSSNHCPPGRPANWKSTTPAQIREAFNELPLEWRKKWKNGRGEFKTLAELLDTYYIEQDYQRCEAYNDGVWHMTGIIAAAIVESNNVRQKITSAGLWGVESDAGKGYLTEIAKEEYGALVEILKDMGAKGIPSFSEVEFAE